MGHVEKALNDYNGTFSCAQSVLAAFAPDYGMSREQAMQVAAGFGSGMGQGWICGAVTGAMMVLGLAYGSHDGDDDYAGQQRTHEAVEFFLQQFYARNKSISCVELLGNATDSADADLSMLTSTACPKFVKDAVEILELILGGDKQRMN
ncbi:MAG: C-GCAxxG-C-C family protein [Armatimonadota bacterium]